MNLLFMNLILGLILGPRNISLKVKKDYIVFGIGSILKVVMFAPGGLSGAYYALRLKVISRK